MVRGRQEVTEARIARRIDCKAETMLSGEGVHGEAKSSSVGVNRATQMRRDSLQARPSASDTKDGGAQDRMELDARGPPPTTAPPGAFGSKDGTEQGLYRGLRRKREQRAGPPALGQDNACSKMLACGRRTGDISQALNHQQEGLPPATRENGRITVAKVHTKAKVLNRMSVTTFSLRPRVTLLSAVV